MTNWDTTRDSEEFRGLHNINLWRRASDLTLVCNSYKRKEAESHPGNIQRGAFSLLTVLLCLGLFLYPTSTFADVELKDLALNGCVFPKIDGNADGSVLVAGCSSVRGLYYSTNSGESWTEAGDGRNTSTANVTVIDDYVYLSGVVDGRISLTDLQDPETFTTGLTPILIGWPFIGNYVEFGDYVFATSMRGNILDGFDAGLFRITKASGEAVQLTEIDDSSIPLVEVTESHLFLSTIESGEDRLYRATLSASGEMGELIEISEEAGLADLELPDLRALHADIPQEKLYAIFGTRVFEGALDGTGFEETFQVSYGFVRDICTKNGRVVIGNLVSNDGGETFTDIESASIDGQDDAKLLGSSCFIDPNNNDTVYLSTQVGLAKTEDVFPAGDVLPLFTNSSSGLRGVTVFDIAQDPKDPSRAVAGTSSGVAIAENYDTTSPTWKFPYCPNSGCLEVRDVAFSHSNDGVFYMVGNFLKAYKGEISTETETTEVSFSQLNSVPSSAFASIVETSPHLPNTVIVGRISAGFAVLSEDDELLDEWLNADANLSPSTFVALSSTTYFAGIGDQRTDPLEEERGVYVTTDSGETWRRMTGGDLTDIVYPSSFSYDSEKDRLYMGTFADLLENEPEEYANSPKGTVLVLDQASEATKTWKGPKAALATFSNFSIRDVAFAEGDIAYATGIGRIWLTNDGGKNWNLIFTSSPIESIYTLDILNGLDPEEDNSTGSFRLIVSSDSGIARLSSSGSGKTDSSVLCNAKVLKASKKDKRNGTRRVQIRVFNALSGEPVNSTVRVLFKNLQGNGVNKTFQKKTGGNGLVKIKGALAEASARAFPKFKTFGSGFRKCKPKRLKLKKIVTSTP